MARQVRQTLPDPPPQYDQQYIAALARSINNYMSQAQALGEVVAGRFIMTDPIMVPGDIPDTGQLPMGAVYLKLVPALFAVNVNSANPASTASASYVMMGLAMQFETVYTQTGIFTVNGQVGNTGNGTTTLNLAYGTGTPPVNGAPLAGTLVGQPVSYKGPSSGAITPFAQTVLLTGITPGVPHWVDVAVKVSNGNSIVQDIEFVGQGLRDSDDYFLTVVRETDP